MEKQQTSWAKQRVKAGMKREIKVNDRVSCFVGDDGVLLFPGPDSHSFQKPRSFPDLAFWKTLLYTYYFSFLVSPAQSWALLILLVTKNLMKYKESVVPRD